MADCHIKTDPAVFTYSPYIVNSEGVMTDLKPFEDDPRCLYGWGPPEHGCTHSFGHSCAREVGHPGKCCDGIEFDIDPCSHVQRPRKWDSELRSQNKIEVFTDDGWQPLDGGEA